MCDNNNLVNYHYGIYSKKRLRSDDGGMQAILAVLANLCTLNIVICDAN